MALTQTGWKRIAARVIAAQPQPEGWQVIRRAALQAPTRWLATGLLADFAREGLPFTVSIVAVPLYKPTQHMYYSYSTRLRSGAGGWGFQVPSTDAETDAVAHQLVEALSTPQARDFLSSSTTPAGFAAMVFASSAHRSTIGEDEAERLGYSLLLAGRRDEAEQLIRYAAAIDHEDIDWQRQIGDRATTILALLDRSPDAAVAQLDAWAQASADAIGIERRA
jgi:hypothetical protein